MEENYGASGWVAMTAMRPSRLRLAKHLRMRREGGWHLQTSLILRRDRREPRRTREADPECYPPAVILSRRMILAAFAAQTLPVSAMPHADRKSTRLNSSH